MARPFLTAGDERLIAALRRLFAELAARQFFAVGKHDFADHADRSALLAGGDRYGDNLAGFQELRIPAGALEDRWGQSFDTPIYGLAGIVLNVEENLTMRIGPIIFGDGAL